MVVIPTNVWKSGVTLSSHGTQADIRYLANGGSYQGFAGSADLTRTQTFVNIAVSLGFNHIRLGSSINGQINGVGVVFDGDHNDHMHIGVGTGGRAQWLND